MQDKTINSALLNLRKQISQGDGVGLDHVEALLAHRGVTMRTVPRVRMKAARKGMMAHLALEALRDGPLTAREVARYVAGCRPELPSKKAIQLTAVALTRLKYRGLVAREGRLGGLWCVA